MTETRAEQEALEKARKAFQADERARQAEQRIAEEEKRRADLSAKTARLRALREARDAAIRREEQVTQQIQHTPRARLRTTAREITTKDHTPAKRRHYSTLRREGVWIVEIWEGTNITGRVNKRFRTELAARRWIAERKTEDALEK
jgi:alkylhydroperoxidase family enzyme